MHRRQQMQELDLNWAGETFSKDFFTGLEKLKTPEKLLLPKPLTEDEINDVVNSCLIDFLRIRFPKFYINWHNRVMQVISGDVLDDLRSALQYYYARCGGEIELKIAAYEGTEIWVSMDAFALEIDGDRQEFEMDPENIKESIQPFASALARNRQIIRGMTVDPDKIAEFAKRKNTLELHMDRCFSRLIDLFIETARRVTPATYAALADIDTIKGLGHTGSSPDLGVKVFDEKGVRLYWAFDKVVVAKEGIDEMRQVPVDDAEKVNNLKAVLRPLAELLFKKLPITDQQIIQRIFVG